MRTPLTPALLLAALTASGSLAGPPVKSLIFDADTSVNPYEGTAAPLNIGAGSIHLLADLDGDGVAEILWARPVVGSSTPVVEVRSPVTGQTLFPLSPQTSSTSPLLVVRTAIALDDIDGDGVRDIFTTRRPNRLVSRVHSGADGALLTEHISLQLGFGHSAVTVPDLDGDGRDDLLLGREAPSLVDAPLLEMSSANAPLSFVLLDDDETDTSDSTGYILLNLGVGSSGTNEYFSTNFRGNVVGETSYFSIERLGGEPLARMWSVRVEPGEAPGPIGAGAAVIGDLNGDGVDDIVTTGQILVDPHGQSEPPVYAMPVFDGATGQIIANHIPRFTVDGAQPGVRPVVALKGIGDITGDGFPDYAVVVELSGPQYLEPSDGVLIQSGRTGQTIAVFETDGFNIQSLASSYGGDVNAFNWRGNRDSIASPGDLNNDGVNDLMAIVRYPDGDPVTAPGIQTLVTHYLPTVCVGDVDFDRVVNFADLNAVLSNFGAADITLPADLNASGVVDFADLNLVLSAFGQACD